MEPSTHRDMSNMTFFVFTFDKIKKVYTLSEHQSMPSSCHGPHALTVPCPSGLAVRFFIVVPCHVRWPMPLNWPTKL